MTCSKHLISIMFFLSRGGRVVVTLRHIQMQRQEFGTEIFDQSSVASWRGTPQHCVLALSTAKSLSGGISSMIGSLFPFETLIERKAAETPTPDGW